MLVLHDRCDDPGRRRGEECLGEILPTAQRCAEIRALGFDLFTYPRMDGSTSTQPLAALIACRCFGADYEWVGREERLPPWHLRAAKAEAELAAIVREAERKVAEAVFIYASRREEAEKLQSSTLPQIREAADLADRNYRTGALPIATYIEVQKQYLDSVDALFAAQSAAIEARQQLEQLTATRLDKR